MKHVAYALSLLALSLPVMAGLGLKRSGWRVGQTINIEVRDADAGQLACLRFVADEVATFANIQLNFVAAGEWTAGLRRDVWLDVESQNGDVATGGHSSMGNTSFLREGMMLRMYPTSVEPTNARDCLEVRTIRHEVGHLLGLAHEHQHPLIPAPLTRQLVDDQPRIDRQFLEPFAERRLRSFHVTAYDQKSVMHYSMSITVGTARELQNAGRELAGIGPERTDEELYGYIYNIEYSPGDRALLRQMYPASR
jgi:hypothetical protein